MGYKHLPRTVQNNARFCFVLNFADTQFSCTEVPPIPYNTNCHELTCLTRGRMAEKPGPGKAHLQDNVEYLYTSLKSIYR